MSTSDDNEVEMVRKYQKHAMQYLSLPREDIAEMWEQNTDEDNLMELVK